jgi:hypothetical protein
MNFAAELQRLEGILVEEALQVIDEMLLADRHPRAAAIRESLLREYEAMDTTDAIIQLLAETTDDASFRARWREKIRPAVRAAIADTRPS